MTVDPRMARNIIKMVETFSTGYREPVYIGVARECEQYVHEAEYRTLTGEQVKGFEKLTVANGLVLDEVKDTPRKPNRFVTANSDTELVYSYYLRGGPKKPALWKVTGWLLWVRGIPLSECGLQPRASRIGR